MRAAPSIVLTRQERAKLRRWARSEPARRARQARIVLLAARGLDNKAIAVETRSTAHTVGRWRTRYSQQGLSAFAAERATRSRLSEHQRRMIVELAGRGAHASSRRIARIVGVSQSSVLRVLEARRRDVRPVARRSMSLSRRTTVVLLSLTRPHAASAMARRYGLSKRALAEWRRAFLAAGRRALAATP